LEEKLKEEKEKELTLKDLPIRYIITYADLRAIGFYEK